jgi:hypothetical protein
VRAPSKATTNAAPKVIVTQSGIAGFASVSRFTVQDSRETMMYRGLDPLLTQCRRSLCPNYFLGLHLEAGDHIQPSEGAQTRRGFRERSEYTSELATGAGRAIF